MILRSVSTYTLLALVPLACSSSQGGGSGGAYAEKCAVACMPPAGPCQARDPGECEAQCTALTEGLSVACAQCIVEHSGWAGVVCKAGCSCGFGPGEVAGCDVGTGCSCSATDETCTGFELAKTSDSACSTACATN